MFYIDSLAPWWARAYTYQMPRNTMTDKHDAADSSHNTRGSTPLSTVQ